MSNLLELHDQMLKKAEIEKEREGRVAAIVKYASRADELLGNEYDKDYTEEDVIKLAEYLIDSDLTAETEHEKVAEYDEIGRIMARSFLDEIEQQNSNE